MDRLKILAIIGRLMFAAESDGLECRLDSVAVPGNLRGAIVECVGNGRFRTFLILPNGTVAFVAGHQT